MKWHLSHMVATVAVVAVVALPLLIIAGAASGTEEMMGKLPSSSRFSCLICHTTVAPTSESSDINLFGADFMANSFRWDVALALKNSDGDGCPNGFELGDRDGDGKLDAGLLSEPGNPGDPGDCTVAIDAATWGKLKKLFEE
jgi:hypothetical protein